jgi:hypothetical protein
MNVKTITYARTKNLGNYESERLEMSIELDDDEYTDEHIAFLRAKVRNTLETEDDIEIEEDMF